MAEYIVKETNYPLASGQEVIGELIRCKECAHRDADGECDQYDDGTVAVSCKVPDDHYCKYGEQRKHDDIVDSNRFCCDTWMGFRSCMRSIVHQMAQEPSR